MIDENVLSESGRQFVKEAHEFLENPNYLMRLANAMGKPVESLLQVIPEQQKAIIQKAVQTALNKGLEVVRSSVKATPQKEFSAANDLTRKSGLMHTVAAFGTGAGGGLFGLATLPIELPITTGIILRSIASVAAEFGMDLDDPEIQLECLYVLSLGSEKTTDDDAMNSAYWTSRIAFSRLIHEAARGAMNTSSPLLVRFLAQVAFRYNVLVSKKAMAVLVPAIGAIGGGAINAAFTNYFNDAARFHFGLKALERKHGSEAVRLAYETREAAIT